MRSVLGVISSVVLHIQEELYGGSQSRQVTIHVGQATGIFRCP